MTSIFPSFFAGQLYKIAVKAAVLPSDWRMIIFPKSDAQNGHLRRLHFIQKLRSLENSDDRT
jgi:hypothetical protein